MKRSTLDPLMKRVLRQGMPTGRLVFSGLGVGFGLLFMMLCFQLVAGIQLFTQTPEGGNGSFLVVNKILKDRLFSQAPAEGFTEQDLAEVRRQPFVLDAAAVRPNVFKVFAGLGFTGGGIGSEVFFEALPDKFLDVRPEPWSWSPDQANSPVPIILARDFLNLYNFGFAGSRGLPQVTAGTAGAVPITLTLSGPLGWKNVPARIVGFSDRISSIVVPQAFLDWANHTFVGPTDPPPLRLVLQVVDPSQPSVKQFLEKQGWETNQDKLRLSRMALLAQILVSVLAGIGVVMAFLGLFLVQVSLRLYLSDQRDNFQLLLDLGASPAHLEGYLARLQAGVLIPAGVVAGLIGWGAATATEGYFRGLGLSINLLAPAALLLIPLIMVMDLWGRRRLRAGLPKRVS